MRAPDQACVPLGHVQELMLAPRQEDFSSANMWGPTQAPHPASHTEQTHEGHVPSSVPAAPVDAGADAEAVIAENARLRQRMAQLLQRQGLQR